MAKVNTKTVKKASKALDKEKARKDNDTLSKEAKRINDQTKADKGKNILRGTVDRDRNKADNLGNAIADFEMRKRREKVGKLEKKGK